MFETILGCGIACHLGILTSRPCVGIAKHYLYFDGLVLSEQEIKDYFRERKGQLGSSLDIKNRQGETLGLALLNHSGSNPIYVSVGHLVGLDTAADLVMRVSHYRVPEPIRQADMRSRAALACEQSN